jgi:hypothetical protein
MHQLKPTHFDVFRKHVESYERVARLHAQEHVEEGVTACVHRWIDEHLRARVPQRDIVTLARKYGLVAYHTLYEYVRQLPRMLAWKEFAYLISEMLADYATVGGINAEWASATGHMLYQMVAHHYHGTQVYDVAPGLAMELAHTGLKGLIAEDLRLPHQGIYIQAPTELGLRVFNSNTGWHNVYGIYVSEDFVHGERTWRFLVAGESKKQVVDNLEFEDDALIFFHVRLPDHTALEDCVAHTTEKMTKGSFTSEGAKKVREVWLSIFRWAMNVTLYITMPGAEVERVIADPEARALWHRVQKAKGTKREKLKERLKKSDARTRNILGATVVFRRPAEKDGDTTCGVGAPLRVRYIRRGHWRKQAFGEERSLRKIIWIKPHWVGSPNLPLGTHSRILVEQPKEETT